MKSTDQKRIADYDAKHGEGAYSKELQKKLNKIYPAAKDSKSESPVTPTGKVVGRENLSPQAQAAIARLEAKKDCHLICSTPEMVRRYLRKSLIELRVVI